VIAIAHHQAAAILATLGREPGDVRVDLSGQRLGQHPPRALPHDLIDQRRRRRVTTVSGIRDYGGHGCAFPAGAATPALLETSTTRSPGRYTLLQLPPLLADPQVSSIARIRRAEPVLTWPIAIKFNEIGTYLAYLVELRAQADKSVFETPPQFQRQPA
jgi:hypothetical protein